MPRDPSAAERARELRAAFERIKEEEPLPPYETEAFNDPQMRSRVGALIARAAGDNSPGCR